MFTRNTTDASQPARQRQSRAGRPPRHRAPRQPAALAKRPMHDRGRRRHDRGDPARTRAANWRASPRRSLRSPAPPTSPASARRWTDRRACAPQRCAAGGGRAQLVPHRPVDLSATGIDYLACSGHKLYAPYGGGALIGRRDWLDAAPPHQLGGGAVVERRARRRSSGNWVPRAMRAALPTSSAPCRWARRSRLLTNSDLTRSPNTRGSCMRSLLEGLGGLGISAAADLARAPRPRGRRQLQRPWLPRRPGRRIPLGRARHRCARREVLRAPTAAAFRPGRHRRRARQHRPRHQQRRRRRDPERRSAGWSGTDRSGTTRRSTATSRQSGSTAGGRPFLRRHRLLITNFLWRALHNAVSV